ncbi:cytochrome c nitrite reductase small subunit [Campylobacter lari]|uniref:cytochrome c nitrite reductase small subunit n=1 Tax=Campylobacter lari TaxID=201 RepID=UPI001280E2F0|nr:cytochrome c nitrite reductase small subunit [Campylobacter lari]EAH7187140.1 cytochrome c nitrite reductase small subunit [Campylobacter lari]EAI4483238.1 cytochrome c nitrite reductase small subunit [Campylobacter lari]EAI4827217.1 cytochrome c nitrite reductase small subunit [Campylobacter lari]EAI7268881.1 cytochrome c nitrite reductase small subunit [Campylobacter lari]EAK0437678.1 cytochrome c nitrite reductase small subunit [Campylobacter lari]
MKKANSKLFAVFLFLLVILAGVGMYTFHNAKGTSYFSDASESCNNCHIMNEVYNDYLKASHSKEVDGKPRATCNDCHLPHSFFEKWIAKAQSGLGHAYAFTFKLNSLPTHLSANAKSKEIVQNNCIECHKEIASNTINPTLDPHKDNSLSCVSCHQGVGHKRGF